jgi:hypothetical protein
VVGVVLILLALFVVGPVSIFFGGAIWSALTGWLVTEDVEARGETEPEAA